MQADIVQPEHQPQQSNPGKTTLGLASKPATIVIEHLHVILQEEHLPKIAIFAREA